MKKLTKKQMTSLLVGIVALVMFAVGATYAYFQVSVNNNATNSTITGQGKKYGTVSLMTNTSKLYLTFSGNEMGEVNKGKTYYANSDSSGTPLTYNPNYSLATASLTDGEFPLDCEYNFKVTAKVVNAISDNSDSDVLLTIGSTTKTLKELTSAGNTGVIINGTISNLVTSTNQSIALISSVTNSLSNQNDLQGNSYTITIEPYSSGDTKSFSCKLHEGSLADKLIASGNLWQSGLEGDGYRFTGSGTATDSTSPKNFICFGTTDKDTCTANPSTYMYRIIGVFADENGDNHVKLIKYTQLPTAYAWNSSNTNTDWADSDLYKGLNGSYFLTNTTYSYMQDNTWLNKITDWKWSAVNTKTYDGSSGPNYFNSLSPSNIYLHEMNRTGKTSTIGEWTTPTAKIGLMYASDYALSLGATALTMTTSTYTNRAKLETGWMHQSNNDTTASGYEWTISRVGANGSGFRAWHVDSAGDIYSPSVTDTYGARPVLYLESDVIGEGEGTLENPIMIN